MVELWELARWVVPDGLELNLISVGLVPSGADPEADLYQRERYNKEGDLKTRQSRGNAFVAIRQQVNGRIMERGQK